MNATEDNDETVGFLNDHSSESASGGAPHVVLQRQVHTYSVTLCFKFFFVRGFVVFIHGERDLSSLPCLGGALGAAVQIL